MKVNSRFITKLFLAFICVSLLVCSSSYYSSKPVIAASPEAANLITVYPTENLSILKNPNRGFFVYGANGGIAANKFTQGVWDRTSVGNVRCDWSVLEPLEGKYDWSMVDNSIAACASKGSKLALGVMCASVNSSTNFTQSTPLWVFDAGAKYTIECGGKAKIPVWNDQIFKAKLQDFITALKSRYDGNSNIAFIDVRSFGNWGEWHLGGMPSSKDIPQADKNSLVDMFGAFKSNIMMLTNGAYLEPSAQYALDTYKMGIRRDGTVNPRDTDYARALSFAYDKVPATAEFYSNYSTYKNSNWPSFAINFEQTIRDGKPSYMGMSAWDENTFYAEQSNLIDRWVNRVGYWLKIVKASYPQDLGNGSKGTFTMKVKNDGVAPLYPNKENIGYVKLALMDDDKNVLQTVKLENVNPFNWKPGEYKDESVSFAFDKDAKGTKLAVGVFTDDSLANPDVKLGINGTTVNNWHILNDMPTEEAENLSANKLYSASEECADRNYGFHEARYAFDNTDYTSWMAKKQLTPVDTNNLLKQPGFEEDFNWEWIGYCGGRFDTVDTLAHKGEKSVKVYGRGNNWIGISQDITSALEANGQGNYDFGAYLRSISGNPTAVVGINISDSAGEHSYEKNIKIDADNWTDGSFNGKLEWTGNLNRAMFYIRTLDSQDLQDIYIDDCVLKKADATVDSKKNDLNQWLAVDFGESKTFSRAYIKEGVDHITGYKIQYYNGKNWLDAYTGKTIGTDGVTVSFEPKKSSKVRLYITDTSGTVNISELKILQ
jgi:hypothetical protein